MGNGRWISHIGLKSLSLAALLLDSGDRRLGFVQTFPVVHGHLCPGRSQRLGNGAPDVAAPPVTSARRPCKSRLIMRHLR